MPNTDERAAAPSAAAAQARNGRRFFRRIPSAPISLKGRAVLGLAAGAIVAGGSPFLASDAFASDSADIAFASNASDPADPAVPVAAQFAANSTDPSATAQVLSVARAADPARYATQLAVGRRFSEERAAREAALRRPLYALPVQGVLTSGFGERWGAQHGAIDIAAPIGTPIVAAADGVVIDSGPASGFGLWVRIQHADGSITLYGHNDSNTVQVGQQVKAGDQIASVGNRGFSTGPHVHFEVLINGTEKIDPIGWLSSKGVNVDLAG
jgi:murein DD-endopeptidase MepM/ murein hydrolase activator NlpD